MKLKHLFSRQIIKNLSRVNNRVLSSPLCSSKRSASTISAAEPSSFFTWNRPLDSVSLQSPQSHNTALTFWRCFHFTRVSRASTKLLGDTNLNIDSQEEEDATMNEFLSRFVWTMRGKLSEAYPGSDKEMIDGMLLIIIEKLLSEIGKGGLGQVLGPAVATPSTDFSEDLWRTVWEVSNKVLEDMDKERKKEKMKKFLQDKEVKEMYRFACQVGIRGDLLRELWYKWAREKMEESEFYDRLELIRKEAREREEEKEAGDKTTENVAKGAFEGEEEADAKAAEGPVAGKEKSGIVSLPKRHGKIKYKIYGLDLSDPKWAKVTDRISEAEESISPQEPKLISGKSKLITEKIFSLKEEEDPALLLAEWKEQLQPRRVDWTNLLDSLKEQDTRVYYKVAEHVLSENSFQTTVHDYRKLIDAYAKESRIEDAERILRKMMENSVVPDILTATVLIHMYCKAGNLDRAKELFESLRNQGFQPDMKMYRSLVMAYVKAGQPTVGESLMREMEAKDMRPSEEIYMALLRAFSQSGDVKGAGRISRTMQFAGFRPSLESCTLLVEAHGQAGDVKEARRSFDYVMEIGLKPDDRCTANMIAAYKKKNMLDKALNLLLQLEKDGFEPGVCTYTVLVDWLCKLQLVEEAEQLLRKIAMYGEAPPFKVHVGLCDMYARSGIEKKALQALGFLEARKEELGQEDFERVINGLIAGKFVQEAERVRTLMESQGYAVSEPIKVALMASQSFSRNRSTRP